MYLQLFYLSIIFSFSYFLAIDFQYAKIRRKIQTAKFFSPKPGKHSGKEERSGTEKERKSLLKLTKNE